MADGHPAPTALGPCGATALLPQIERGRAVREGWEAEAAEDTLVLVYNMACPLKCDFCCHPVEDYGPIKTRPETAIEWIRQAAATGSCNLVVFTGGEPFLYHRDLVRIFGETRDTGVMFRIVTAAHWAESIESAKEKLRPLIERGLGELSVSSDPSHQKFVPASYAENALRAALELGIVAEVASVFWSPDERIDDTVDVPLGALRYRGLVVPIGRAKNATVTAEQYRLGEERFLGCGKPGNYDATVYPDGEVYPCCSGGFNIQARLSFGNIHREPLPEVLARMHADPFTRLILTVGLGPVWEIARLRFPAIHARLPPLSPYTSLCQACARVHSDSEVMDLLRPVLAYATEVFAAIRELEGATTVAPARAATLIHP